MRGHELFGVVVRTLGLWLIVQAILSFILSLASLQAFISVLAQAIVGAVLFFGANGFVRTAYHRIALDELEPPISR